MKAMEILLTGSHTVLSYDSSLNVGDYHAFLCQ